MSNWKILMIGKNKEWILKNLSDEKSKIWQKTKNVSCFQSDCLGIQQRSKFVQKIEVDKCSWSSDDLNWVLWVKCRINSYRKSVCRRHLNYLSSFCVSFLSNLYHKNISFRRKVQIKRTWTQKLNICVVSIVFFYPPYPPERTATVQIIVILASLV